MLQTVFYPKYPDILTLKVAITTEAEDTFIYIYLFLENKP